MKRFALIIGLLAVLAAALSACTQSNPGGGEETIRTAAAQGPVSLSPQELRSRMDRPDVLLVNVHVPYEGQIPGTHLQIPFDQIDKYLDQLPADRSSPVAVYCMSGRMSEIAADKLTKLGYREVMNLDGGMIAWDQAGQPLVDWQR